MLLIQDYSAVDFENGCEKNKAVDTKLNCLACGHLIILRLAPLVKRLGYRLTG